MTNQDLSDDEILAYAHMPKWYWAAVTIEGDSFRVVVLDVPGLEAKGKIVEDVMVLANELLMRRAQDVIAGGGQFPLPSHPSDLKARHPGYFAHPWLGAFLPSPAGQGLIHLSSEFIWSESPSGAQATPPSPEEMNQRAAAFWDIEVGWSDEMRDRALERMKTGAGTWEEFVAFARDFRARATSGTCHPQTIEWLSGALENVLSGRVPPTAFGASKKP